MSTELLDPPAAAEAPAAPVSPANRRFSDGLESILNSFPEDRDSGTPAAEAPAPAAPAPVEPADPAPDATEADEAAGAGKSKNRKTFAAFRQEQEQERERLKSEYEAKLKDLSTKAETTELTAKQYREKLEAAEALKANYEQKALDLEKQIVESYEAPYSLELDPEAVPVLQTFSRARQNLDNALMSAVSGLHDDEHAVRQIYQHKDIFVRTMAAMSQGLSPDSTHAKTIVDEMAKQGIHIELSDARQAVRELKAVIPTLREVGEANLALKSIEEKNRPNWTRDQAARHEAERRMLTAIADVPEDGTEGDDALFASVLKADPELRNLLKEESERVSTSIAGPAPGKANAAAVRAAPKVLRETAMRAARLPVLTAALRKAADRETALNERVKELEGRINSENDAIPRPSGNPVAHREANDSRPFKDRLADVTGIPAY